MYMYDIVAMQVQTRNGHDLCLKVRERQKLQRGGGGTCYKSDSLTHHNIPVCQSVTCYKSDSPTHRNTSCMSKCDLLQIRLSHTS